MTRRRWGGVVGVVCALALGGASCGSASASGVGTHHVKPLAPLKLPDEVLGLKVRQEDVDGALRKVNRTYVESSGLVSMRTADNLVQATLQVNRFQDEPRYRTPAFRRTVVTQLGSTEPRPTRMGSARVWRTTGTKQIVAVWFRENTMLRLAIREEFDQPRTLIRALVEMDVR